MLGFLDEVWWTRLAQPSVNAWTADGEPLRLFENAKGGGKEALACYGIYRRDTGGMMLRFVEGRPVSAATEEFLGWAAGRLAAEGKKVFVVVWDNASWHVSGRVREWVAAHNREVRREGGGCRIRLLALPVKAPWLNPIEPKWMHGKRNLVEPARKLTAEELKERVHRYYGCEQHPDINIAN